MIKLWGKSKTSLEDLLRDSHLREILLGVERKPPVSDEKTETDANRILNYARSEDYKVYAQELWRAVVFYIKILTDSDAKDVDFYRGCLSATLDDLKISYKAFQFLESQRSQTQRKNPLNGRGDTAPLGRN